MTQSSIVSSDDTIKYRVSDDTIKYRVSDDTIKYRVVR